MILESPTQNTEWSTGEQSQSILIAEPGNYWATIEDINGCSIVDTIKIEFEPAIFVPNAFSPNFDGTNDEFRAYFSDTSFELYTLKVFDRWGGLKFYSNTQDVGWDGKYKEELCPTGVYVYVITYSLPRCGETLLKGDVALFR